MKGARVRRLQLANRQRHILMDHYGEYEYVSGKRDGDGFLLVLHGRKGIKVIKYRALVPYLNEVYSAAAEARGRAPTIHEMLEDWCDEIVALGGNDYHKEVSEWIQRQKVQ